MAEPIAKSASETADNAGLVVPGCSSVLIESVPIACVGDQILSLESGPTPRGLVVSGSPTVLAEGRPVALAGSIIAMQLWPGGPLGEQTRVAAAGSSVLADDGSS